MGLTICPNFILNMKYLESYYHDILYQKLFRKYKNIREETNQFKFEF